MTLETQPVRTGLMKNLACKFLGKEKRTNPGYTEPCDRISRVHVVHGILRRAAYPADLIFAVRQRDLVLKGLVYWFVNSNNRKCGDTTIISRSRLEHHAPSEKTPGLSQNVRLNADKMSSSVCLGGVAVRGMQGSG